VRTPRVVEKRIPVTYTYRVPRVVTMKVPVSPCEDAVAMPTTACCGETVVGSAAPVQVIQQEPYYSSPASGQPHPADAPRGNGNGRSGDANERPRINPNERVPRPIDEDEATDETRTGSVYDK
jgi:hypothetical protein